MSSGSGKKKVVAGAASPLSLSISPNPVLTGGIKLLIDRSRIVNVPSPRTQSVAQRQPVHDIQKVSLITSNEDNLTNGSHAVHSPTSATTAPATQNIIANSLAPSTVTVFHGKGATESGVMRVKVTGEDRNGQSMLTGGQLVQVKHYNSLLGRRPSTNRRLTVPATPEADGIIGQQAVPHATITLSDGNSLKQRVASTNLINSQPAKTPSTTVKMPTMSIASSINLMPASNAQSQAAAKTSGYRVGVTDVYSFSNTPLNVVQHNVSFKNDTKKWMLVKDISSSANNSTRTVTYTSETPTESVKEQIDKVVTNSGESTSQDDNLKAADTVTIVPNDSTGMDAANLSKVAGEEPVSKPSREVKSLQLMQSTSKILTEFIADTSSKGKLRKRHSDGAADLDPLNIDSSANGTTTQSALRKRLRRQSTINMDAISKGLATNSMYRLDDMVINSPAARGRKVRANKSEFALQKNTSDSLSSTKDACKDFFTSLNLGYEPSEQSFPANPPKPGWDRFCWRCKKPNPNLGCSKCIRSYHELCVRYTVDDPNWSCTECKMALNARVDIESMSKCLGYVLGIIAMNADWNEAFNHIDKSGLPHYDKYITRHMDLTVLKNNVAQRTYKAPEEFLADMSWIVHNSSIYPENMFLLKMARVMLKKAKYEVDEMEPCHECYVHANTKSELWFTEPCSKPHLLVWAKLKGYPYWPGKLYMISATNQANVRFFATHDRSWMPVKDCFLYSQQDPYPSKSLKSKLALSFANSVKDVEYHITRLREQFNTFHYGSFMELVDPSRVEEQLRAMLPGAYLKKVKVTIKRSEGEMIAVASASNDEEQTPPKNKATVEMEKNATLANKEPAKKETTISPPRKRMTRRMSRILRNADEASEQPLTNAECFAESQEVINVPIASVLPNNDKPFERSQSSDRMNADKIENSAQSESNPKNISLLIRRGSQSWETEPLSKRRKSTIDKSVLSSVVPVTDSTETSSTVQETVTNMHKDVAEPIVEKETNTLGSIGATCSQHAATQDVSVTPASGTPESGTNSASDVSQPSDAVSKAQTNPDSIEIVASGGSDTVCKTPTSTISSKDSFTASTDTSPSPISEVEIKQEIITGGEVNAVKMAKDIPPSSNEIGLKEKSTTLDAASGQTMPAVNLGNVVESVQQTPPDVLTISAVGKDDESKNISVTTVPSNQRARKSFPGGAGGSITKSVTSKITAPPVPKPLLPATLDSGKQGIVAIPISLISAVDNRNSEPNDVVNALASVSNDNDDVMIIEDNDNDTVTTTSSAIPERPSVPSAVPGIERESNENQLPPPLVPKPSVTNPPPSENTVDLDNTMQLFDDSSNRVLDHIRIVMEDMLKEMSGKGSPLAEVATLKLNLERQNELWMKEKQLLQHGFECKMAELRISLGQEKERALKKQRQQLVAEKERAVKDTKMKQWCKKCYKEASYYCCWNTSYCTAKCQEKHWTVHKDTHSTNAEHIRDPVQPSISATNLMVSQQPDNNASLHSRSCLNISLVPTFSNVDSKNLNKRSPNNRVVQNEITPASTAVQAPVRYMPSTLAGNVGFKTPIIQSVHGRDSIVIKMAQQSAHNGSNATYTPNTAQQQQQQKKIASRDQLIQPNVQKTAATNKVYVPPKAYIITSPYQSPNMLTSTTTIAPLVTPSTYATVTPSAEVACSSRVACNVWNQMTMMQPAANRQLHSGTTRQNQPTVASIVQNQTKTVQQPSTTYMRHQ